MRLDLAWEHLRDLLASPPDEITWTLLLDHLQGWPDPGSLEVALGYASDHLAGWPDALRALDADASLPDAPWLALCRVLRAEEPLSAACVRSLHLQHLTRLDLSGCGLGDAGMRALALSPALCRLESLELRENGIHDDGLMELIYQGMLQSLSSLGLASNPISPRSAWALADAALARRLRTLDLARCPVGDRGAEGLADSSRLDVPERLDLSCCLIGDRGAASLASWPRLTALTELRLACNSLGPEGAAALTAAPRAAPWALDLGDNPLGLDGLRALVEGPGAATLTELSLVGCRVGDPGAEILAGAARRLGGLRSLDVRECGLSPAGWAALRAAALPPGCLLEGAP